MTLVNLSTLEITGTETRSFTRGKGKKATVVEYTVEIGTVEVTLQGRTQRCPVSRDQGDNSSLFVRGMTGRYVTGTTAWPATIRVWKSAHTGEMVETINFGRDERSGRFNKANCLFFTKA